MERTTSASYGTHLQSEGEELMERTMSARHTALTSKAKEKS
jgi:hypothetical protein